MNPDSLPSFDEWLNEAMTLASVMSLCNVQTVLRAHDAEYWDLERKRQKAQDALLAHLAAHPSNQVPEGYALVPCIGTVVKAKHPITCLNPTEFFEVTQVRAESDGKFAVRGEQTCWFGLGCLAASPQAVPLLPEQPIEQPTADKATLGSASGGDDLQTALPKA